MYCKRNPTSSIECSCCYAQGDCALVVFLVDRFLSDGSTRQECRSSASLVNARTGIDGNSQCYLVPGYTVGAVTVEMEYVVTAVLREMGDSADLIGAKSSFDNI